MAVVASKIAHLRDDNEFLAGVNAEFSSENDDLKEEVNKLKTKLEQYQIRSLSKSIDIPDEQSAKWFKLEGSKKGKKSIEMKMFLKTIKPIDNLDDNETFSSLKNVEIHSKLIPELQRKKLRRIKTAKDLYRKSDERIIGYEKRQLLKMLANRSYHSLKVSETDEKDPDKTILKNLLRNILDSHSDAPQWSYVEQEDFVYDTEIDSKGGFNEDKEEYDEETEEVLIDSQKNAASNDL
ncbi:hypothetical protein C1646_677784 [Rhizophagus diaphanus]|nr:hypothetical protein C1646_677784 [Rhizophagus diaphanus] [Rhizophagus sp. MUCL 43196]